VLVKRFPENRTQCFPESLKELIVTEAKTTRFTSGILGKEKNMEGRDERENGSEQLLQLLD